MDEGFISSVLAAVSPKGAKASQPIARALLRFESPELAQEIRASQLVAQLVRTSGDDALPMALANGSPLCHTSPA